MRTCVRVSGGHDPARRPGRVLCLGRAARRPPSSRSPGHRRGGVVLAASYEAKAYGVRTAMGGAQARRLCPQAVVVPPRMSAYAEASKAVFEVFARDHAAGRGALDRRGVPRRRAVSSGSRARRREIAARLRREVRDPGRPADHGRGRHHQVPRQGGERGREARRAAGGAAGRRARLSPPAPGGAALGSRPRQRREAARTGPW